MSGTPTLIEGIITSTTTEGCVNDMLLVRVAGGCPGRAHTTIIFRSDTNNKVLFRTIKKEEFPLPLQWPEL